ncbi:helicase [Thecaphora frezii]
MDPITKLKAKFTPPTMLRRPSAAAGQRPDPEGRESPSKRPRLLSTPTATMQEVDVEDIGPSQPPAQAIVLSRSRSTSSRLPSTRDQASNLGSSPALRPPSAGREAQNYPTAASSDAADGPFYLCTWRKPQFKKHKTWDGDAVLIVKNDAKTCTLRCTETGKDLCSRAAFNYGQLESGDQLTIGGKEIEIDRQISRHEYQRGHAASAVPPIPAPNVAKVNRQFKAVTRTGNVPSPKASVDRSINLQSLGPAKASTFYAKMADNASERPSPVKPSGLMNPGQGKIPHARFDPKAEGAIVMKRPDESHQKRFNSKLRPVVDVVVDPQLTKALRPHQVEGVKFMYERVMGMHAEGEKGQGVILADEMGLGKTLQTITLILTLMKQNCYYTAASCTIERALIVCPLSLVKNWKREFRKWIGNNALNVLCIDGDGKGKEDVERFVRSKAYQVLVIGYEKLRTCVKILKDAQPPIGLIVCDEGHRLKSRDAKTTKMFQELSTPRRIILSGTPIQNDLSEFYAMIDFVVPGLLGEYPTFKKVFEDPILKSRAQHCTKAVRELGESRSDALLKVTHDIILRRTAELLTKYLQPKHEMVLFCSPSTLQLKIYKSILSSGAVRSVLRGEAGSGLVQIGILRKLCNTPELLLKDMESEADSATKAMLGDVLNHFPEHRRRYEAVYSGKLLCVMDLFRTIKSTTDDRVVFISNFTSTLDIMEGMLRKLRYKFVRLDGQTPQDERMGIVNAFNRENASTFVFLLSAKSGGVGLNLIGANRLILFDSDWNPSTDQQAMARIHRDGQKKPCYIYRMLLSGTMDEKIYQRQLSKLALSDALMNSGNGGAGKRSADAFTQEELLDIFTLHTNTACLCHKQLACNCDGKGGGSAASKSARKGSEGQSRRGTDSSGRSQDDGEAGDEDDDDDDDDNDDEDPPLPGFVAASQHVANAASNATKDRRAKLAALHDWAHYDCYSHPDSFQLDIVVSRLLQQYAPIPAPLQISAMTNEPSATAAPRVKQEKDSGVASGPSASERDGRSIVEQLDDPAFQRQWQAEAALSARAHIGVKTEASEERDGAAQLSSPELLDDESSHFDIEKAGAGRILFAFAKSSKRISMGGPKEGDGGDDRSDGA